MSHLTVPMRRSQTIALVAFALGVGLLVTSQTNQVFDRPERVEAQPLPARQHVCGMLYPLIADIRLALTTEEGAARATITAEITALTDLFDSKLVFVPGMGASLLRGVETEPLGLAQGETLTRSYEIDFAPSVRSSVTLRVQTPANSTERTINLPYDGPAQVGRKSPATFDSRAVSVTYVADGRPDVP